MNVALRLNASSQVQGFFSLEDDLSFFFFFLFIIIRGVLNISLEKLAGSMWDEK